MTTTTRTISSPGFRATVTTFSSESNSSGSSSPNSDFVGGYSPSTINEETTALLNKALGTETLYATDVPKRVCFTKIKSLSQQTVAGINYKYVVDGCSVSTVDGKGECSTKELAACTRETYTITVFEQKWTDTTTVSKIVSGNSQESGNNANKDQENSISPAAPKSAGRRSSLGALAVLAVALTASAVV